MWALVSLFFLSIGGIICGLFEHKIDILFRKGQNNKEVAPG